MRAVVGVCVWCGASSVEVHQKNNTHKQAKRKTKHEKQKTMKMRMMLTCSWCNNDDDVMMTTHTSLTHV